MSVPHVAAGRTYGLCQSQGRGELRAQFLGSETFADHYSQARQFYLSQTPIEQAHIAAAFTFELSKVETLAIRARMVSHLLNVDQQLAQKIAEGLRLKELPSPAEPARP